MLNNRPCSPGTRVRPQLLHRSSEGGAGVPQTVNSPARRPKPLLGAAPHPKKGAAAANHRERSPVAPRTVSAWLERYREAGVEGFDDHPRSGWPRLATAAAQPVEKVWWALKDVCAAKFLFRGSYDSEIPSRG